MSNLSFETEDAKLALLSKQTHSGSGNRWTTVQCVLFVVLAIVISGLLSNVDRIVDKLTSDEKTDDNFDGSYDTIVVGAGPAGLFQGHFLQKEYPSHKILVIEQLNRTGGRQFSSIMSYKNIDNTITIEHGALRFMSFMPYTFKLLYYLNLCDKIVPWRWDELSNATNPHAMFSSRNNYLLRTNNNTFIDDYWINNYNLLPNEELELQTISIHDKFLQAVIAENDPEPYPPITDQGWYKFRNEWTLNGIELNKWSMPMLFRYFNYSTEFEQLTIDRGGVENQMSQQYVFKMFGPESDTVNVTSSYDAWTLSTGYDSMSRALAKLITDKDSDGILFNNKVIAINEHDEYKYAVKTSQNKVFKTNNIILAIPSKHLQELLPNIESLRDDSYANYLINSMDKIRTFCKMNLIFDHADDLLFAMSNSMDRSGDLGWMCIYDILGEIGHGSNNTNLTGVHFYISGESCDYWWSLQLMTNDDLYDQYIDDIIMDNMNDVIVLSNSVINELMLQFTNFVFTALNVTVDIKMPIIGFITPLGNDMDFAAGLHKFKIGVNVDNVLTNISHPNRDENIYIGVMDYASSGNFWVEGSLTASIENMMKHFNMENVLNNISACQVP